MGTSARTLQRRLSETKTTFQKETGDIRVAAAKRLMLTSKAPLSDIALDVGCASQQHFSALFRKVTGEAPGSGRQQFGGDDP